MIEPSTWIFHGATPFSVVVVCARTLKEACGIADLEPKKVGKYPDPAAGIHIHYWNLKTGQIVDLEE